jgi:hypothetical protein
MSSVILMLVAVVASGALFVKGTVLSSNQVRSMRWRTKLRLRPGTGFASHWEITFRFSRLAALYHGRRCRPDMTFWMRLVSPARLYAVRLGPGRGPQGLRPRRGPGGHRRPAADQ